jgi:hypothetical protein
LRSSVPSSTPRSLSSAWRVEYNTYSARKGTTHDAWRMAGVEPLVLKAPGLNRGP